jgi:hypothetical protein
MMRLAGALATSSVPWFLEGINGFSFNGGQRAQKAPMEPRMLMKIKQLSVESQRWAGLSQKTNRMKLNRLSIQVVGYHRE